MPGPEYSYDPAFFERSAQLLEGDALAMVEFPQTDSRMIPASQNFFQLVTETKIAHDGDPALARHVGNVIADQKPRGAYRMSKPKGSKRRSTRRSPRLLLPCGSGAGAGGSTIRLRRSWLLVAG